MIPNPVAHLAISHSMTTCCSTLAEKQCIAGWRGNAQAFWTCCPAWMFLAINGSYPRGKLR